MNREVVVIESAKGQSKFHLLNAALEEVRLEELLEITCRESGKSKGDFLIVIKPNLAMFFKNKATITDPQLVEHLVDRLYDLGYARIVLGEAQNVFNKWLQNRGISTIAEAAGYGFLTLKQRKYEVFDLSQRNDLRECNFPEECSLAGTRISKYWQDADFRINFAKNKTHEQYMYSLCLKNLLGVIPEEDKLLHDHYRSKVWDVCFELYRQFPVHFNIIDAYESNHGNLGSRVPNPIKTETIIAGVNAVLVDWVGAIKMGIDPILSPLNREALKVIKLPENYQIIGSLHPYTGWKNAHPSISESFFRLDEASTKKHISWPSSFIIDSRRFPWKRRRSQWNNLIISLLWGTRIDRCPLFRWVIILISCCSLLFSFMKRAWRTLFNKKKLRRKDLPINLTRGQLKVQDCAELPNFIRPKEEIIEAIHKKNGSCHTFLDEGILYYVERDVDFPFDEFVSKVQISKSLAYMRHYIGGRTVQAKFDLKGRCTHQFERTVFLPQPNLMVVLNGKDIDITKLQLITYREGHHKIIWKTVFSDNQSAVFDAGTVTFERINCRTRIKIMAHQNFVMPVRSNRPGLRRFLMLRVYRRYFKKTIENYCSVAKGEYRPIGSPRLDEDMVEGGSGVKLIQEERHLAWILRVYAVLFAIGGFLFLLFPQIPHFFTFDPAPHGIGELIKSIGGGLLKLCSSGKHWKEAVVTIPERFWVFSFFAMMLTISAGCYIASLDVRRYRKLVIPVLVEKLFAAFSGLIYFLFWPQQGIRWFRWDYHYFPFLLVFLIDFPLFVLLLILFLRAQTGAIPEAYATGILEKDRERYKPMLVGEDETIVSIARKEKGEKFEALDQVIEEAKFFRVLEKYQKKTEKKQSDFKIVIKPNFMMTYSKEDRTTYTDPGLVEHLIKKLSEKGYTNLTVVESQNTYGNYFKNRDVISVGKYVAYNINEKGVHEGGLYKVVDMTKEMVCYDYGGSFGQHYVSPTWRDADFRISFAKNKTHSFCYFTLTIKNIYGTLPVQNKYLEYHKKREIDWPTIEALKHFPVHFGFIDAWISGDGQMGVIADVTPEETRTIIGGEKLVAVDHVGAKLMGLDPTVSRFQKLAVDAFGNPERGKITVINKSGIEKYDRWDNVDKLLPELLDVGEELPWIFSHFFMSVFIYADADAFPLKVKSRIIRWVRESPIIEWAIDQFFATHRRYYKQNHKKRFAAFYPGGEKYAKAKEY